MYKLLHEGKEIFKGSHFECLYKLQRIQPFSYDYATKYGSYKIVECKTNKVKTKLNYHD